MNLRLPGRIAAGLLLAAAGVFVWALVSVEVPCTSAECAKPRYRVSVRLDVLQGAEAVPLEVQHEEQTLSLTGLFEQGGVELHVTPGRRVLPYDPSAGALDEADLASYAQIWSGGGEATPDSDGHVYAIVAPALRSARGVPLFGVLFDHARREGVAVAPAATRRLFARHDEAQVPLLQMRSFAHELLHALNRYHADAAQSADGRLTVEAPTSCIAEVMSDAWRLRETPLWTLSPSTIRHFQSSPRELVVPGAGNAPFDVARVSARDCDLARRTPIGPAENRLELALDRVLGLLARTARAAEATARARDAEAEPAPGADEAAELEETPTQPAMPPALRLIVPQAPVPLGFPLRVVLEATNTGDAALPLRGRLMPEYAQILIEIRREGEQDWRPFHPLQLLEPIDDPGVMLAPGERTAEAIEVYFGEDGWSFAEPGRYELRARHGSLLAEGDDGAATAVIEVVAPSTEADAAALAPLLVEGRLDDRIGRFLALQGRVADEAAAEQVRAAVDAAPGTALVAALQVALASRELRSPIDPQTGMRPVPEPSRARARLQYVCRDSGLSAHALSLARAAETAGLRGLDRVLGLNGTEPWEGRRVGNARGTLRYLDPALRLQGVIGDFAFGADGLPAEAAEQVALIAAEARAAGAQRLLVAGHADGNGSCRGNSAAAWRRAEAVAAALRAAGWTAEAVEVVTLGANRPVDFSAGEASAARNRRVEIWAAP